ncbi:hypothetical protein Vadar_031518 [Vaccinium darrowii]|uniref:Uncharacterized protein n=1 Tax=Vaccinium darrowii TaxID=229202 RepID=A0ACB7ZP06_9ERIC|nr:hypothetical protein Vadar_031518 [Vaccinium darrowii]
MHKLYNKLHKYNRRKKGKYREEKKKDRGVLTLEEGKVEMKEGERGSSSLMRRMYAISGSISSLDIILYIGKRLKSFTASAKRSKSLSPSPPTQGAEDDEHKRRRRRSCWGTRVTREGGEEQSRRCWEWDGGE